MQKKTTALSLLPDFTPPHLLSGLPENTPLLVAFSGGADSSVLLRLAVEYGRQTGADIYAAHVNHGIRGAEADRDEEFCKKTAQELGVKLFVLSADVPSIAAERKESIETAARNVRYEFFERIMRENSIPVLLTAHHAGDNLETMLFNIARGCGLGGACGIPQCRPLGEYLLVRPILRMTREKILAFCEENSIEYVTDSTNTDNDYTRNKIRNEIIPLLCEINPSAVENATRLSESLRVDASCLDTMTEQFLCASKDGKSIEIEKLLSAPRAISVRAITALYSRLAKNGSLEYTHIEAIHALAKKAVPHSSLDLPERICVCVENKQLVFSTLEEKKPEPVLPYTVELKEGANHISQSNCDIVIGNSQNAINIYKTSITLYIDSAKICGSIYARERRGGDKIRMGGMAKSVKKLFCDKKIPLDIRARLPIICDESGILAVPFIGVRDGAQPKNKKFENIPDGTTVIQLYVY